MTPSVLVVEDDAVARKLLRIALESGGYRVEEAADGTSAIASARNRRPDLVVQDLSLPDMTGEELARTLRGMPGLGDVPLVACSGWAARLNDAGALFAERFLKPVEPSRLLAAIAPRLGPAPAPDVTCARSRTRRHLDVLAEATESTADGRSPRDVLTRALAECVKSGVATRAAGFMRRDGTDALVAAVGWPADAPVDELFGHADLLRCDGPVQLPSATVSPLRSGDLLRAAGVGSLLLVPLGGSRERVGSLVLAFGTPRVADDQAVFGGALATQLSEALALSATVERLAAAHRATISCLARAGEFRDDDTARHTERMAEMCGAIARRLGAGREESEALRAAAKLHDLGKIGVPDAILHKPGQLTEEERAVMQTHCAVGHSILSGFDDPLLRLAATVALTHHERVDGGGYPQGLRGDDIPIAGRIAAVADVYDALTSDRSYRPAMSAETALDLMGEGVGTHFDPAAFEALLDELGR